MRKATMIFLVAITPLILVHLYVLQHDLVVPVRIVEQKTVTVAQLRSIGVNSDINKIATAVEIASKQSGLSPEFLIALMYTESSGNLKAVSKSGYKGLMQIPHSVYQADANVLIGAHIFKEKLKLANNNLILALCLYKGYGGTTERGVQQARKVIALRDRLRKVEV